MPFFWSPVLQITIYILYIIQDSKNIEILKENEKLKKMVEELSRQQKIQIAEKPMKDADLKKIDEERLRLDQEVAKKRKERKEKEAER